MTELNVESTNLKPCPFCGEGVEIIYDGTPEQPWVFVNCSSGFCDIGVSGRSEAGAIKSWNRRPSEDAYLAIIASMEAQRYQDRNTAAEIAEQHDGYVDMAVREISEKDATIANMEAQRDQDIDLIKRQNTVIAALMARL